MAGRPFRKAEQRPRPQMRGEVLFRYDRKGRGHLQQDPNKKPENEGYDRHRCILRNVSFVPCASDLFDDRHFLDDLFFHVFYNRRRFLDDFLNTL